jgi:hypothetical protein
LTNEVISGNDTATAHLAAVILAGEHVMNQNLVRRGVSSSDIAEVSLTSQRSKTFHAGYWAVLSLSVLAAYGPLALVNQPFWDDWVMIGYSNAGTLWELFKQLGRREQYILMAPFTGHGGARACILTVLLLYCLLAPLIYTIIRRTTRWPATEAFWAALLTALVPLDQARFVVSTVPYAFSSVFFALAIVVLLRDLELSSLTRRALIVILLVMAFSTNSFLVLSWLVPAIIAIDAWRKAMHSPDLVQRLNATIRRVLGRSEILLLPPVYWLGKKLLEPTYGLYANYNQFRMGVPAALKQTVIVFIKQFGETAVVLIPRRSDLPELAIAAVVAVVLLVVVARIWRLPLKTAIESPGNTGWIAGGLALLVALALIFSSLFPYVMVGEPPRFSGLWETRHQTTLTMVSGFAIFALLRLIVPRPYLWMSALVIVTGFLALDISFTQRMIGDALETGEIAQLFKTQPSPPGTMTLVVEDDRNYRALGRFLPFQELAALINAGQTGDPRIAVSNREVIDPSTGGYPNKVVPAVISALVRICQGGRSSPQYNFGGFVSNGQIETIKLTANREPPTLFQTISEAARAVGKAEPAPNSTPMVRFERETSPIGGACVSPCCSDK